MGACLSLCSYDRDSDAVSCSFFFSSIFYENPSPRTANSQPQVNESAPLLNDSSENTPYGSNLITSNEEDPEDRQRRDMGLKEVVDSARENLIDILAIEQPEMVRDSGNLSVSLFKKEFLKEFDQATEESSNSSITLIDQIQARSVDKETKEWLDQLSKEAYDAIQSEPAVKPVGELVLKFDD